MFEKESEKYQEEVIAKKDFPHCISVDWQRGAEFGYNNAKEDFAKQLKEVVETCNHWQEVAEKANEWHYIKDELPPENIPLNILTLDKDKKKRLWTGEYKGGNGEWWTGYFNHFIDKPYAWKEITLPKE
jgi:hypothetical protein